MKQKLVPLKSHFSSKLEWYCLGYIFIHQINTYSGFQEFLAPLVIEMKNIKEERP